VTCRNTGLLHKIDSFSGTHDYVEIITASAYIPLPTCPSYWAVKTRDGKRFYDKCGGRRNFSNSNTFEITTTSLNGTKPYGGFFYKYFYMFMGMFQDYDWLYHKGYSDAKHFLLPILKSKGISSAPPEQVKSTLKLKEFQNLSLNYNNDTQSF